MKQKILSGIMMLVATLLTVGCSDNDDYGISTDAVVKSITTGDAAVTAISATTSGTVSDLSKMSADRYQVGTIFSTDQNPTAGGVKQIGSLDENGNITAILTGLEEGTTYYYASYVTLQGKVTKYGDVKSFVATDADVATAAATDVTACHATFNGQATGVDEILGEIEAGFRYATSPDLLTNGVDFPLGEAAKSLSAAVKGLIPSTTYYYAAYNKVGDGYILGNTQSFTTADQEMEYVDLGLSVLWAKCNIGAEEESEAGILVGFGDQSFYNHSIDFGAYTPWDIAGTEEDVLYNLNIDGSAKMKSTMPTALQVEELLSKTTHTYETVNGVAGIRFTANNGNSIFLPVTGYRHGSDFADNGEGYYWTGNVSTVNEQYAKVLKISGDLATADVSQSFLGLAIRSVRLEEPVEEGIAIRNYNVVQGDIEDNGNYRVDIYNQWDGSGTGSDETAGVIPSEVNFQESISVTFTITGIGNATCNAFMCFADGTWATQNWGFNEDGNGSCVINGDGTYTMSLKGSGSGLGVFAIDFIGLSAAVGAENINVKIDKCVMDDWGTSLEFDNAKLVVGDIENNGNVRADIYNQWDGSNTGSPETCGVDINAINFSKRIGVTFEVTGTDGGTYNAFMCFADGTWATQNWGFNEDGNGSCVINGDGIYSMTLAGSGSQLGVFAIDIIGLGAAVGADNVKVRIAKIRVE